MSKVKVNRRTDVSAIKSTPSDLEEKKTTMSERLTLRWTIWKKINDEIWPNPGHPEKSSQTQKKLWIITNPRNTYSSHVRALIQSCSKQLNCSDFTFNTVSLARSYGRNSIIDPMQRRHVTLILFTRRPRVLAKFSKFAQKIYTNSQKIFTLNNIHDMTGLERNDNAEGRREGLLTRAHIKGSCGRKIPMTNS